MHFCARSSLSEILFQIFYLQNVDKGQGVQFLQIDDANWCQNLQMPFFFFIFAKIRPVWTIVTQKQARIQLDTAMAIGKS